MKNWDELKTAYKVASLGKVSLAAKALNVHRSTVIRQIDSLEERLGIRLFVREQHGYTPTLEGEELLRVVESAEREFIGLENKLSKPQNPTRTTLTVTSVSPFSPTLLPTIRRFCFQHPEIKLSFIGTDDFLQLEYGEADIAIRPGLPAKTDMYKTEAMKPLVFGLFADRGLKAKHQLNGEIDFPIKLPFVLRHGANNTGFEGWTKSSVPDANIIYQSSCVYTLHQMIVDGLAAGFMPKSLASNSPNLEEIHIPDKKWRVPFYLAYREERAKDSDAAEFLTFIRNADY